MANCSKRIKVIKEKVERRIYAVDEAISVLQKIPRAKFDETVDVAINLGVDAKKSDQIVRGSVVLPKGTGKAKRVAVFVGADEVEAALAAGADLAGLEDLAQIIKAGQIDFDVVLAVPDAMRVVGQIGQILGPRGLMPNPKDGTVTRDIVAAIHNVKAGQIKFRVDKGGVIHCPIGKLSFAAVDLQENLNSLLLALRKAKPSTAKGVYFKKITISSTMGPGLGLRIASQ